MFFCLANSNHLTNHYQILGISETASQEQIRQAYKSLAKRYHPDINPDPIVAEQFKEITAAYNVLSDPNKKFVFDNQLVRLRAQQQAKRTRYQQQQQRPQQPYAAPRRESASYRKWTPKKEIKFDPRLERLGNIFVVLFFVVIGIIVFSISSYSNYLKEKEKKENIAIIRSYLLQTSLHYQQNDQKQALILVDKMKGFVHRNLNVAVFASDTIDQIFQKAKTSYVEGRYSEVIWPYLLKMQYSNKQDEELIFQLATAYRLTGEYEKAQYLLVSLLERDYSNLKLISLLAILNEKDLKEEKEAEQYYQLGLDEIEASFKSTYGNAYRLLVSRDNVPDIYKEIYRNASRFYFETGRKERAKKLLEWVLFFEPQNAFGYELLLEYYLSKKDYERACRLLKKASKNKAKVTSTKINC